MAKSTRTRSLVLKLGSDDSDLERTLRAARRYIAGDGAGQIERNLIARQIGP